MLVVLGHIERTLSQEFDAFETFFFGHNSAGERQNTHTQPHTQSHIYHKKCEWTTYPWALVTLIPLQKKQKEFVLKCEGLTYMDK